MSKQTRAGKPRAPWRTFFSRLFWITFLSVTIGLGYGAARFYQKLKDMPDISLLEKYEPIEAIQIYDRNDRLLCTVEGDEDRRVVPLTQVAPQMQQAMLAAEDHHFYEHHGINVASILRALITNLQAGHVVEGGSTITQQLIKNLFFEDKGRTLDRKVKEAFLSYEIERRYPKDKILEMYLNQVYFGNGGYGIERAASRYFDATAGTLTLAESAFLAGLVKAPSELGDPANRTQAITRQKEILDRMVEYGYITDSQAKKARADKLRFKKGVNPLQKYPYYISTVLQLLRGRFSEAEMRRQGLKVFTNCDPTIQELAEHTLTADLNPKKVPKGVSQSALVCVSVRDGAVLALVGGVGDFWKFQFNRATNPHTAGSSFKPFVYLTAFRRDIFRPESIIDDSPITIKQGWGLPDWSPKDFDHRFLGKITVRKALMLSRNVPSVRIGKAVGIDNVIETARLAGITTRLDPNLSLALGSSAVTPLDMAGAYSTFARGGVAIKPQLLRRIENSRGQVVDSFEPRADKVFEPDAVAKLVSIMQDVVAHGTGTAARLEDRPCAGKTGTADAGKDIWFVGFTPDTVCALWGGNDENLAIPGHNVTGGAVMAKIWKDFMTGYYEKRPQPPGAFLEAPKPVEDLAAQGQSGSGDLNLPKLVPVTRQSDALTGPAETGDVPYERTDEGGAPPPVWIPTTTTGAQNQAPPPSQTQPTPLQPSPYAPAPVPGQSISPAPGPPSPVLTPNAVPRAQPAPGGATWAPVPASTAYSSVTGAKGMPPVAPAYATSSTRSPTFVLGADGRSQRTIINEGERYSSLSDPNLNPGLNRRRFAPTTSQPAAAPGQ